MAMEDRMNIVDYLFAIYPSYCCDDCEDLMVNYMDCPTCKTETRSDDSYYDEDMQTGHTITCKDCRTKFSLVDASIEYDIPARWKVTKNETAL